MKYISTRQSHEATPRDVATAMTPGVPGDGGLYVPETFPSLGARDWAELASLSIPRRLASILHRFVDILSEEEWTELLRMAMPDPLGYQPWRAPEPAADGKIQLPNSYYSASGLFQLNAYEPKKYLLNLTDGPTASAADLTVGLIPAIYGYLRRRGEWAEVPQAFHFLAVTNPAQVTAAIQGFALAYEQGLLDDRDQLSTFYSVELAKEGRSGVRVEPDDAPGETAPEPAPRPSLTDSLPMDEGIRKAVEAFEADQMEVAVNDKGQPDLAGSVVSYLGRSEYPGVRLIPLQNPAPELQAETRSVTEKLQRTPISTRIDALYDEERITMQAVGAFPHELQSALRRLDLDAVIPLDERHLLSVPILVARILSAYVDLLDDRQIAEDEPLTIVVPSSDLTIFLAVAYAAQMGMPLRLAFAGGAQDTAFADWIRTGELKLPTRRGGKQSSPADEAPGAPRRRAAGSPRRSETPSSASGEGKRQGGRSRRAGRPQNPDKEGSGKRSDSPRKRNRSKDDESTPRESGNRRRRPSPQNRQARSNPRGKNRAPQGPSNRYLTPYFEPILATNLERLLFELAGRDASTLTAWWEKLQREGRATTPRSVMDPLRQIMQAGTADKRSILDTIRQNYDANDLPVDPHTAACMAAYAQHEGRQNVTPVIYIEAHHPLYAAEELLRTLLGNRSLKGMSPDAIVEIAADEWGLVIPEIIQTPILTEAPAIPLDQAEALWKETHER